MRKQKDSVVRNLTLKAMLLQLVGFYSVWKAWWNRQSVLNAVLLAAYLAYTVIGSFLDHKKKQFDGFSVAFIVVSATICAIIVCWMIEALIS